MKILQISYCDSGSESAVNALCLHRAFRRIGIVKFIRQTGFEDITLVTSAEAK